MWILKHGKEWGESHALIPQREISAKSHSKASRDMWKMPLSKFVVLPGKFWIRIHAIGCINLSESFTLYSSLIFPPGLQSFQDTLTTLRQTNQGWIVPEGKPLHGVGHSNGALLHLLIGSQYGAVNDSNVAISYNNKWEVYLLLWQDSLHYMPIRLYGFSHGNLSHTYILYYLLKYLNFSH